MKTKILGFNQFFDVQRNNPMRGDWVYTCRNNLEEIKLGMSLKEIKETTKGYFAKILKQKIRRAALEYLLKIEVKKGLQLTRVDSEWLVTCNLTAATLQ